MAFLEHSEVKAFTYGYEIANKARVASISGELVGKLPRQALASKERRPVSGGKTGLSDQKTMFELSFSLK